MANTIKHKRGSGSDPSASDLVAGELAIRTDTGAVFTKKDDGTVAQVTGASVGGATGVDFNDDVKARFGTGNDLEIYHNGTNSFIDNATGDLYIRGIGDDLFLRATDDIAIQPNGNENGIIIASGGAVELYHNNSKKLDTKSDGIDVTGEVQCDSLDVDGNVDITGTVNFHNTVALQDDDHLTFGNSSDLEIYHDGSNSYIKDDGTGALRVLSNQFAVRNVANAENMIVADQDGAVNLYHNGSGKLGTKSDGVDITGELQCDTLDVDGAADFTGVITSSEEIRVDRSGATNLCFTAKQSGTTNASITAGGTGTFSSLTVSGTVDGRDVAADGTKLDGIESGATADQTASEILTLIKTVDGSGSGLDADTLDGVSSGSFIRSDANDNVTGHTEWQDNYQVRLGNGADFRIYHDGTHSRIENHVNGLFIQNQANDADVILQTDDGSGGATDYVRCSGSTGEARLYHYGTKKFNTKSDGVNVVGEVECDSIDVNGAGDISGNLTIGGELNLIGSSGAKYMDVNVGNTGTFSIRGTTGGDTGHSFLAQFQRGGPVTLYHNGGSRLTTQSYGVDVTGEVQCDSLDVDGAGDFTGDVTFRGGAAAVNIAASSDIRLASGSWTGESTKIQHHSNVLYIQGGSSGIQFRSSGGTDRCIVDSSGHLKPSQNNTYDLGTSSLQWRDAHFDGEVNCDGLACAGNATITSNIDIDGALRHNGDTNTYLEFPSADTFRVVTAGVERFRITSTGAISIEGTANYGTSGQVLTSNGNDAPTWQDAGGDGYTAYAFATTERNGSITSSQGFASCTRNGTGNYTLTFSTAVGSTAYTVVIGNEDGDNNYLRRSTKASASITYTSRSTGDQSRDMRQGVVVFKQ